MLELSNSGSFIITSNALLLANTVHLQCGPEIYPATYLLSDDGIRLPKTTGLTFLY